MPEPENSAPEQDPGRPQKRQTRDREVTKAADWKSVYSNDVQSRISPWDVRLSFNEMVDADDTTVRFTNVVDIVMSPPQLKSFWLMLGRQVARYEETFGEIDLERIVGFLKGAGSTPGESPLSASDPPLKDI